jgi:hypothetical protein
VAELLAASQEMLSSMGLASSAINHHCLRKKIYVLRSKSVNKIGQSMASRKLLFRSNGFIY